MLEKNNLIISFYFLIIEIIIIKILQKMKNNYIMMKYSLKIKNVNLKI